MFSFWNISLNKIMLNKSDEILIELSYSMDDGLLKSFGLLKLELVNNLLTKVQHPLIEQ